MVFEPVWPRKRYQHTQCDTSGHQGSVNGNATSAYAEGISSSPTRKPPVAKRAASAQLTSTYDGEGAPVSGTRLNDEYVGRKIRIRILYEVSRR